MTNFWFTTPETAFLFFQDIFTNFIHQKRPLRVIVGKGPLYDELKIWCSEKSIPLISIGIHRTYKPLGLFNDLILVGKLLIFDYPNDDHIVSTPKAAGLFSIIWFIFRWRLTGRFVFYCHGLVSYSRLGVFSNLIFYIERFVIRRADHTIFVSPSLMGWSLDNRYLRDSHKCTHVRSVCGVDQQIPVTRPKVGTIGFIGRLEESKGIDTVLRLFHWLSTDYPDLVMAIAGTGDDRVVRNIRRMSKANHAVMYLGFVSNTAEFYRGLDLLIFPSRREGFGKVIIEAGSWSIPTVAYDISGVRDAVRHGESGVLVEDGDEFSMYGAVRRYLEDDSLYNRHSKMAREIATNEFGREMVARSNVSAIENALRPTA